MIKILFTGYQLSVSCHDITENEFESLKSGKLNIGKVCALLPRYSIWDSNYFYSSRPVVDESLELIVIDESDRLLWSGGCNDIPDVYAYANNFPEIQMLNDWDEPDFNNDAIACERHPWILYFEEISQGIVGVCKINTDEFNPNCLSFVKGCLETEELEWEYISKLYYNGKVVGFEPLEIDLRQVSEKFKLSCHSAYF